VSVVVFDCRQPAALARWQPTTGLAVRSVCADCDAELITGFGVELARVRGVEAAPGPLPRAGGLLAELASRPGRTVEAWLAVRKLPGPDSGRIAGLASLVICRTPTGWRHSIGWLLVHPADRRQGVGRTLVAQACRRAVETAAETVWAESRADWAGAIAFWPAVGFSASR